MLIQPRFRTWNLALFTQAQKKVKLIYLVKIGVARAMPLHDDVLSCLEFCLGRALVTRLSHQDQYCNLAEYV